MSSLILFVSVLILRWSLISTVYVYNQFFIFQMWLIYLDIFLFINGRMTSSSFTSSSSTYTTSASTSSFDFKCQYQHKCKCKWKRLIIYSISRSTISNGTTCKWRRNIASAENNIISQSKIAHCCTSKRRDRLSSYKG